MPEIATQAEDEAPVGAPEGPPHPAEQDGVDEMYKGCVCGPTRTNSVVQMAELAGRYALFCIDSRGYACAGFPGPGP